MVLCNKKASSLLMQEMKLLLHGTTLIGETPTLSRQTT